MKPAYFLRLLGVVAGLTAGLPLGAQPPAVQQVSTAPARGRAMPRAAASAIPLDAIPAPYRDAVSRVVNTPTLTAHAGAEEFLAGPYDWLLENPDRVSVAWRRLGIPCVGITKRGPGRFGWNDGEGSDITWTTVAQSPEWRVWLAEGSAKGSPMLPVMPVKAVAILRTQRRTDARGKLLIQHEIDVYLQTESKAAVLLTKLLGPAAPHLAEQGASQLLLFFSAMARYLDDNPEQISVLFRK